MRFRTTILGAGKNAAGIVIPPEVMEALGPSKKPAVTVTVGGHVYRSTVATVNGRPMVGISAENRNRAGVDAGDEVDVEIQLDKAPRVVEIPDDFATALSGAPDARTFFDGLPYSQKQWFVLGIEDAKTPETRARRIEKAVTRLGEGRGQR
jgi:hypothetical protein